MKKILIGILLLVAFSALAGDSLNSEKEMLDLANKVISKFHIGDGLPELAGTLPTATNEFGGIKQSNNSI